MKMYVYIVNMEDFLNGNYDFCLTISTRDKLGGDWALLCPVEVDIATDTNKIRLAAAKGIEKQIKEIKKSTLEDKRQQLMAIDFDGDHHE